MQGKFSVIICDDHAILLEGLRVTLQRLSCIDEVLVSSNIEQAIQKLQSCKIDLAIVDLALADSSGLTLINYIKMHSPNTRSLVYTSHEEIWYINALMRSELDGVVFTSCTPQELQHAVECILNGDKYFCEQFKKLVSHIEMHIPQTSDTLTAQEKKVLCKLAKGMKAKEIADELFVSVNTINTHKAHLLSKFNAANTTELIIKAFVKGLVELKV